MEGSSIELTFQEKESHYEALNIIVFGLSIAPGRQPGAEPNQQPQMVPLPNVQDEVAKRLGKKDCKEFVKKLLNQVSSASNPANMDLLDVLKGITIEFADQGMTRQGHHAAGRAKLDASGKRVLGISPKGGPGAVVAGIQADYVDSIFHELTHLTGANRRYTDSELARAAYAVAKNKIPKKDRDWYEERFKNLDPTNADQNSQFYDEILRMHCSWR